MRRVEVRNVERAAALGRAVGVADRWWLRLRGLLGQDGLPPDGGLMLTPCRSVHMFGMRFPLDVVFADAGGRVVALYATLAPGGRTAWHRGARHAIELPAGAIAASGTRVGDRLTWRPVGHGSADPALTEAQA